uniref:Uncharacterized protein n=1 Tax=Populus alba TaxID=43335 RepID=A0A4U5MB64_POPAL|nr:uncharacterized protein D5086_0000310560 [Populus alba]
MADIPMQSIATTDDNVRINMPDQILSESKSIILQVSSKLRGFAINLLAFLGIKQIYDLKKIHFYSDQILRCMCAHILTLGYEEYNNADVHVYGAFHNAVKNGMVEFITEMIKACPHLMISVDGRNSRHLIMSSIAKPARKSVQPFLWTGSRESRICFRSR